MTLLSEAILWFQKMMKGTGALCPCCGRWGKENVVAFNAGMVKSLVAFYRHRDRKGRFVDFMKVFEGKRPPSPYGQPKYWGLLEQAFNVDPKLHRSGNWRITDKGKDFLKGRTTIPKFAVIFNDHATEFRGPEVKVHQCMNKQKNAFDYSQLMAIQSEPDVPTEPPQLDMFP